MPHVTYYRCTECNRKTSTTNEDRAAARVCVNCRPDLDAAPAKAKVVKSKSAPRAKAKIAAPEPEPEVIVTASVDAVTDCEPVLETPVVEEVTDVIDAVATADAEPAEPAVDAAPKPEVDAPAEDAADAPDTAPTSPDAVVPVVAAPTAAVVPSKRKKPSALDAAALVLREAGVPMTAKEIFGAIMDRHLWESPNGRTPDATIAAAMLREAVKLGDQSRFLKSERGKYIANPAVA